MFASVETVTHILKGILEILEERNPEDNAFGLEDSEGRSIFSDQTIRAIAGIPNEYITQEEISHLVKEEIAKEEIAKEEALRKINL